MNISCSHKIYYKFTHKIRYTNDDDILTEIVIAGMINDGSLFCTTDSFEFDAHAKQCDVINCNCLVGVCVYLNQYVCMQICWAIFYGTNVVCVCMLFSWSDYFGIYFFFVVLNIILPSHNQYSNGSIKLVSLQIFIFR